MFTSERQKLIEAYILEHGSVTVQELSDKFQVSSVTVRKDLNELEKTPLSRECMEARSRDINLRRRSVFRP